MNALKSKSLKTNELALELSLTEKEAYKLYKELWAFGFIERLPVEFNNPTTGHWFRTTIQAHYFFKEYENSRSD